MSLNSKKSWHPSKAINRAKVSKLEDEEEAKRKLAILKTEELAQERELARLKEEAKGEKGTEKQTNKLAWMYETVPESHIKPNASLNEETTGTEQKPSQKPASSSLYSHKPPASNDSKQNMRKAAADPLAQILSRTKKHQNGIGRADSNRISKPSRHAKHHKSIDR